MRLAQFLSETGYGRTLNEMAAYLGVGRRTAERLRDALGQLVEIFAWDQDGKGGIRRFHIRRIPNLVFLPAPTEMAELEAAIGRLRGERQDDRAELLKSLKGKIEKRTLPPDFRKIESDAQALIDAEASIVTTGPGPRSDPQLLHRLREAILSLRKVRFTYRPRLNVIETIACSPVGLLLGRRTQLVAITEASVSPVQFRIDRIFDLSILTARSESDGSFDIRGYAAQSFGIQHDDTEDVVLRFDAKAAPDVRNWHFHESQSMRDLRGGGVEVRLRCSGMLELAWHLFTWGPNFEIVAPERLKRIVRGELVRSLERHAPGSVKAAARTKFAPPGTTWESYGGGTGQP